MQRLFGISNNVRSRVVRTCTPELFRAAIDAPGVAAVCSEIEDALEAVRRGELSREEFEELKADRKRLLPVITPHATFRGGRRVNADAVPSGLCMLDVDHLPDARGFYEANVRGREAVLGILLAHITPSCEGLRLVFVLPDPSMELEVAQRWMAGRLGMKEYDGAVKDLARCSFLVPRAYFLYLDEAGLFGEAASSAAPAASENVSLSDKGANGISASEASANEFSAMKSSVNEPLEVKSSDNESLEKEPAAVPASSVSSFSAQLEPAVQSKIAVASEPAVLAEPVAEPQSAADAESDAETFRGIPYADIIHQWLLLTGGEPVKGERNTRLHRLALHLRYITDNDEQWLLRLMPRYGLGEEEMKHLIHSACSSKLCGLPAEMKQAMEAAAAVRSAIHSAAIVSAAGSALPAGSASATGPASDACPVFSATPDSSACPDSSARSDSSSVLTDDDESALLPPPMPEQLPALIGLLLRSTPEVYRPAVAHAVFPALGAHLYRTSFRYIDNVLHEATLMNVLMAGTGAGKDCISEPINRIMADIRERDAENLRREREWKEEVTSKGANKDKRRRPEGLVIQEIDADMTNPAFVMRTAEADGHFLYTKMNEIDQFDALRGSARGGQQFQIMCLAFDPGNRYGQTRVGAASVTEKVCVRFNWNASTTILKGKRYFSRVLTDGPVSRINFCTIPEREIGAEMPVYGSYGPEFDEELRPYIDSLCRASGEVDCPEARRLALQLREECVEQAVLSQNRVYENLSFRATVIAWLKGCVLYVANGCRWDPTFDAFVRWSLHYDLWCKMEFFGREIEEAMQAPVISGGGHRGPQNLLSRLPDRFTFQEALNMRIKEGMTIEGTWPMVCNWKSRGYIRVELKDNRLPKGRDNEIYIKR